MHQQKVFNMVSVEKQENVTLGMSSSYHLNTMLMQTPIDMTTYLQTSLPLLLLQQARFTIPLRMMMMMKQTGSVIAGFCYNN